MIDDYFDDYPLLGFELSDDPDDDEMYDEESAMWGVDGPELTPLDASWDDDYDDYDDDYDDDTDDDTDDDYDDEFLAQPWADSDDETEEYYALSPSELSSCYEEWEDCC